MILSSTSVMFITWRTRESALQQKAPQNIDGDKSAEIADVTIVIDGGSAGIHANFIALQGMEFFYLAGQRVVEAQRHV